MLYFVSATAKGMANIAERSPNVSEVNSTIPLIGIN